MSLGGDGVALVLAEVAGGRVSFLARDASFSG